MGPKNLLTPDAALAAAKAAKKPLALVFVQDDELRSRLLLKALEGLGADGLDLAVLAKTPFSKDSEDAKRWKVAAPGAMALLDVSADEPKLLKLSRVPSTPVLRKDLEAAAKAVTK